MLKECGLPEAVWLNGIDPGLKRDTIQRRSTLRRRTMETKDTETA